MSVGCSLGCKECDGGTINGKSVGTNPNGLDRCSSGLKPWKNNDPLKRTFNRNCSGACIGTEHDFTKYNPCVPKRPLSLSLCLSVCLSLSLSLFLSLFARSLARETGTARESDDVLVCGPRWRAPGAAPTYDPCGRAGGGPRPTGGKGEYVNTSFATFGQLGSTLPKQPSGAVWRTGEVVETLWNVRANHGGGCE